MAGVKWCTACRHPRPHHSPCSVATALVGFSAIVPWATLLVLGHRGLHLGKLALHWQPSSYPYAVVFDEFNRLVSLSFWYQHLRLCGRRLICWLWLDAKS